MIDRERIEQIVEDVLRSVRGQNPVVAEAPRPAAAEVGDGMFEDMNAAVEAAFEAQRELVALGMDKRAEIIQAIRDAANKNTELTAQMAIDETQMGRLEHKITKDWAAANLTPGIEDLEKGALTGDDGLTVLEGGPFGVIAAITPVTNPTSTVINNAITMIAAGNAPVFCPHPQAQSCTTETMKILYRAAVEAGAPPNLMTSITESTLRTTVTAMKHEKTALICATGGGGVVRAALEAGKKTIAAGPGNPPVIVDEQVLDMRKVARDIVEGAYFDNNMPCTCEKEIIVLESVADDLIRELKNYDSYLISPSEEPRLTRTVVQEEQMYRPLIGKDAAVILAEAGVTVPERTKIGFFECGVEHPLVEHEQLLPIIPLIRVRTFEEAIQVALEAEHSFGHTAIIHSTNMERITEFARRIKTTIFVVNAPSYAWAGIEGEGFTTLSVAGPTGEGLTSPRSFVRKYYLVIGGTLNPRT